MNLDPIFLILIIGGLFWFGTRDSRNMIKEYAGKSLSLNKGVALKFFHMYFFLSTLTFTCIVYGYQLVNTELLAIRIALLVFTTIAFLSSSAAHIYVLSKTKYK